MYYKTCFILFLWISLQILNETRATDYEKRTPGKSINEDDKGGFSSANYKFQYGVREGLNGNGNDFGHEEERNGHQTRGQYRVLLPDGHFQIVTYTADENGYRAQVTYENTVNGVGYASPPEPPKSSNDYGQISQNQNPKSGFSSKNLISNSGTFVTLQRNINGQSFNYAF